MVGTYLAEVRVSICGYEIVRLVDALETIKLEEGGWLDLMKFLTPLPWFGAKAKDGFLRISCVSSAPVTMKNSLGRLPDHVRRVSNVITGCRFLIKCGEGKGNSVILLQPKHPTYGLLIVPDSYRRPPSQCESDSES